MLKKTMKNGASIKNEDTLLTKTDSMHYQKIHVHTTDTILTENEKYVIINQI